MLELREVLSDVDANPPPLITAVAVRIPIEQTSHVLKFIEQYAERFLTEVQQDKRGRGEVNHDDDGGDDKTVPAVDEGGAKATHTSAAASAFTSSLSHLKRVRPLTTPIIPIPAAATTAPIGDSNKSDKRSKSVDVLLCRLLDERCDASGDAESGRLLSALMASVSSKNAHPSEGERRDGGDGMEDSSVSSSMRFLEWLNAAFATWQQSRSQNHGGGGGKKATAGSSSKQQPAEGGANHNATATANAKEKEAITPIFTSVSVEAVPAAIPTLRHHWEHMNLSQWPLSGPKPRERPAYLSRGVVFGEVERKEASTNTHNVSGGTTLAASEEKAAQLLATNADAVFTFIIEPLQQAIRAASSTTTTTVGGGGGRPFQQRDDKDQQHLCSPIISVVAELSSASLARDLFEAAALKKNKDDAMPRLPLNIRSISMYFACEALPQHDFIKSMPRGGEGSVSFPLCRQAASSASSPTPTVTQVMCFGPYHSVNRFVNNTKKMIKAIGHKRERTNDDDDDNDNNKEICYVAENCGSDGLMLTRAAWNAFLFDTVMDARRKEGDRNSVSDDTISSSSCSSIVRLPFVRHATFQALIQSSITSFDVLTRSRVGKMSAAAGGKEEEEEKEANTSEWREKDCGDGVNSREGGEPPRTDYLCNDLDVVTSHEPCVMCTMACVHSRVRRVIYAGHKKSNGNADQSDAGPATTHPTPASLPRVLSSHGGLSGRPCAGGYKLHTQSSLNHRFGVFEAFRGN